jgi:hypothetical protein
MPILSARCARRNGRSASRGMNLRILRAKSDGHLKRGNPRIKLVATRRQSIQDGRCDSAWTLSPGGDTQRNHRFGEVKRHAIVQSDDVGRIGEADAMAVAGMASRIAKVRPSDCTPTRCRSWASSPLSSLAGSSSRVILWAGGTSDFERGRSWSRSQTPRGQ